MSAEPPHVPLEKLEAGLADILQAPADRGRLQCLVRRPEPGRREVLDAAELDVDRGLIGDNWATRGSRHTEDGSAHPDMQTTLMCSRVIDLLAADRARWPLAGDQLYVDMNLSRENLPPGTRLRLGGAVLEVTAMPHTGCGKFLARFGKDALRFVNSPRGRELCLRGINARVVESGTVRLGDRLRKV